MHSFLTHWSGILLEKLIVAEIIKVPRLLCSVSCAQELTTDPDPDESSPHIHILFLEDSFYIFLFTSRYFKWSHPLDFRTKNLYAFLISPVARPTLPLWLDQLSNIWWMGQIMKFLINMYSWKFFRNVFVNYFTHKFVLFCKALSLSGLIKFPSI
jgi:hypothetical protein